MADVPVIDLDPYLLAVQATLEALQAAGLIPDLNPLDYIIGAFDGRPKLLDTELAALRLQSSPWWPLRALGNNLQIWVKNGVPLSTGIAADRLELTQWIQGTIDSLEPIVFNRFNPYSLDHAIWLAMTSQFGDQAIRQLNDEIANQHALGPLPVIPPPPTPPPPPPLPGQQSRLDSADGDLLADIGSTLFFENTEIYNQLLLIGTALTNLGKSDCCAKLEGSLGKVVVELTAIAAAVAKGGTGSVTIDLGPLATAITDAATAVVRELDSFKGSLTGSSPAPDLTPLVDALNVVGQVLTTFEKCVCDWLKKEGARNDAADALAKAVVSHWATLFPGDAGTTQLVLS
jgi:hypothetical protein